MKALLLVLPLALATVACSRPPPRSPDATVLTAPDGSARALRDVARAAPLTVAVFIAADCPCLDAHLERIRALATSYGARGVQFVAIDSEVGGTPARAAEAGKTLRLPFPVLVDERAELADAVGAEFATYTVVVDREARVLYRGGIDSDKRKLHGDATPYVADALEDALAGRPVRRSEGRALGCSLRKW